MNVKTVQKIILSETKKKLRIKKNNTFIRTKKELMNITNNILKTELKQMLIIV